MACQCVKVQIDNSTCSSSQGLYRVAIVDCQTQGRVGWLNELLFQSTEEGEQYITDNAYLPGGCVEVGILPCATAPVLLAKNGNNKIYDITAIGVKAGIGTTDATQLKWKTFLLTSEASAAYLATIEAESQGAGSTSQADPTKVTLDSESSISRYAVSVPIAGAYRFRIRYSFDNVGGRLTLSVNGATQSLNLANTGQGSYAWLNPVTLNLFAGVNVLILGGTLGAVQVDKLELSADAISGGQTIRTPKGQGLATVTTGNAIIGFGETYPAGNYVLSIEGESCTSLPNEANFAILPNIPDPDPIELGNTVFEGNSITSSGYVPGLDDWNIHTGLTSESPPGSGWGMAASEASQDYVHKVAAHFGLTESQWKIGNGGLHLENNFSGTINTAFYDTARDFLPDTLIVRVGENATGVNSGNVTLWKDKVKQMVNYIVNGRSGVRVIITGIFWSTGNAVYVDAGLQQAANELGATFVELKSLDWTLYKAMSFTTPGVQDHPGDSGMTAIASRIIVAI